MKIRAIRLKNLTSIEGVVEIDLTKEPLRSAGIFAISGPTGAGKSTLLDALCLALYDKAPRFTTSVESVSLADVGDNQIGQSDVRNLLRRGTSDGYAEVDFLGIDGRYYRSRWSVRRTRNKAGGSLQPQVLTVKELETEKELQGNRKELLQRLVELVGLTYEQFTRTVLLAQNDFATFLKSRGVAKAELLEKLTGTDIYSRISQEIFLRNKSAQAEVALIQGKMSVIELLPEDEWHALQEERQILVEKRAQSVRLLEGLNEQLNIVRSLEAQEIQWKKKLAEEQEMQMKLKMEQERQMLQEEEFARFKMQWERIQPDLKKARQLDAQIQTQQEGYVQSQQIWTALCGKVSEQEKKRQSAAKELHAAYLALARLLNRTGIDVEEGSGGDLEQAEQILQQEEQKLAVGIREDEMLLQRLNAFEAPSLVEEQGQLQAELTRQQSIRQVMEAKTRAIQEIERIEKELSDCTKQLSEQEVVLKTVQRLYESARLAVGKDVKALRRQLQEGVACPVCGSTLHPYHRKEEIADHLFQGIEQEYNQAMATFQEMNHRTIALQRDLSHQRSIEKQMNEQWATLQRDGKKEMDEQGIRQRLDELAKRLLEYRRLSGEWLQSNEQLKKRRAHCEALHECVSCCRLNRQQELAAKEQLTLLQGTAAAEQQRLEGIGKVLNTLRQERALLLKGKNADDAERAVARKEQELLTALERVRKEVESVCNRFSGLQGEKKQLAATMKQLQDLLQKIEQPDRLPEIIKQQQEEGANIERRLSVVEARLLQQEKSKQMATQMAKELAEREIVADRWAKLNKLIGSADGAKFKVIAQSYTLNLLLLHANQHLAYLSRRYRLQQVPGTLALQVVDGDMGDEIRTVYSLSGGESFLISLALALGLSSLSSNNLKVESLFIDEGFGSLDAESLRTVMEALEQLQMQGRQIGVISHVQEMSERIAVQIQVHKKVNGKSVLTVVG